MGRRKKNGDGLTYFLILCLLFPPLFGLTLAIYFGRFLLKILNSSDVLTPEEPVRRKITAKELRAQEARERQLERERLKDLRNQEKARTDFLKKQKAEEDLKIRKEKQKIYDSLDEAKAVWKRRCEQREALRAEITKTIKG